jgi:hypothetical protein
LTAAPPVVVPVKVIVTPEMATPSEAATFPSRTESCGVGVSGETYVYVVAAEVAEVPSALVTFTSTGPAAPAGIASTIWLAVSLTKLVTLVVPKITALAPAKSPPLMVTVLPPDVGPDAATMLVTAG